MKVGIALNMLCQPGRSDASVVGEHLAMGDLAEPLGFDSLFALEHHFTGYAMSPAPTQLLAYYRRAHQAGPARHRGHRAAVARPGAGRRADRAARHPVRRALPVRLRARRRQRRIRGVPHPDGRGAAALCRGGADHRQGAGERQLRARGRVLPDPAHRDPAAADLASRAALLRLGGQPGLGRDHGQARLRPLDGDAERMAEGGRGHPALPRRSPPRPGTRRARRSS